MSNNALQKSTHSHSLRGNQNKSAARPFSDTLRTVLFADSKKRMNSVVHALVAKAEEGDIPAIREIADRIEGKVALQIESTILSIDFNSLLDQAKTRIGYTLPPPLTEID